MYTWKRQSVEMAAVHVSGTVTNDNQCAYIKIETLRGKTAMEIHSSLMEVCGVETVDRSTISRWAQHFCEGRLSIENDPKAGRPWTSTDDQSVDCVLQILEEDHRMTWRNCTLCWNFASICLPHFDWTLAQTSNCHLVGPTLVRLSVNCWTDTAGRCYPIRPKAPAWVPQIRPVPKIENQRACCAFLYAGGPICLCYPTRQTA